MTELPDVPCNGCTLCCHRDMVRLLPEDNPSEYEVVPHPIYRGEWMLKHKPNDDCVYLGDNGCTIHDRKPLMCRRMDCRNVAAALTYTEMRKLVKQGKLRKAVWLKGKELIAIYGTHGSQRKT